jgi:hypothetical protein
MPTYWRFHSVESRGVTRLESINLSNALSSLWVGHRPVASSEPGQCNGDLSPIDSRMVSIISMTIHWNRAVKVVLRLAGLGLGTFALLFAVGLWYSTAHGYMTWWFSSSSQVVVDGVRSGFLHVNRDHSRVIITRTDLRPSQSYLVGLSDKKSLTHCGNWQAPRLPAFPIGDVNPPCSFFSDGSDLPLADNAELSTLTARPGFVEFQTEHGKRVTASW